MSDRRTNNSDSPGTATRSRRSAWRGILVAVLLVSSAGCESSVETEDGDTSTGGNACDRSCANGESDCCVGYVCEQEACTPRLEGSVCFRADFPVLCDPRLAETGCDGGRGCILDVGDELGVHCGPSRSDAGPGEPCDENIGCQPTLLCGRGDVCMKACCSAAECATGELCSVFFGQLGSLGVCQ